MKQPEIKNLKLCDKCYGSGNVMGLVMRICCEKCAGHGVTRLDGGALDVEDLSPAQSFARSQLIECFIDKCALLRMVGPESAYSGNNGRGAGGSNFTGD